MILQCFQEYLLNKKNYANCSILDNTNTMTDYPSKLAEILSKWLRYSPQPKICKNNQS